MLLFYACYVLYYDKMRHWSWRRDCDHTVSFLLEGWKEGSGELQRIFFDPQQFSSILNHFCLSVNTLIDFPPLLTLMVEEFPIYTLDEVEFSLKDEQVQLAPPLHEQVARKIVFNQEEEVIIHNREDHTEEEQELASESRVIYPSDVQNDISEVFNQGVSRAESPQTSEEIEFTLRTLRNRVTSLEIQNAQLSQQVTSLELELNATEDKYENRIVDLQEKMDNERFKHRNELLELTKKHQEEYAAKKAFNGKVENIDQLRREHDNLIVDHQRLEARMEKAVGEHTTTKTDLSLAKIEITKLKTELTKLKTDYDASKVELNEKNSELARLKRDGEQGKGGLDQQVKQLTADKKKLDDQVYPRILVHCTMQCTFFKPIFLLHFRYMSSKTRLTISLKIIIG